MGLAAKTLILVLASICSLAAQERHPAASGQVRVLPNGHWLEFRGKPILLVGDSITQGWMELGTDFDQEAYLHALGRRGINAVLLWSYNAIVDQKADERIGYDAPELWPWIKDHGRFDLGRFNDAYFDRLREFVRLANDRNIVVVITVHDGWPKTRFTGHPFNRTNGGPLEDRRQYVELHDYDHEMPQPLVIEWSRRQKHQYYLERFCDRLLQATADQPNVMYEMFNEGEWYDQQDLRAFQVHFLKFFRARTTLPLVVNDDHVGGPDVPRRARRGRPLAAQTPLGRLSPGPGVLRALPIAVRRPAGQARLLQRTGAGVSRRPVPVIRESCVWCGARFWAARGSSCRMTRVGVSRRVRRWRHMRRIATPCWTWKVTRRGSSTTAASISPKCDRTDDFRSTGICLASPGKEYVIYAPGGERFTVDLSGANGRTLSTRWYDPTTGKAVAGDEITGGGAAEPFQPPFAGDAVLHLSSGSSE